ncbi:DUF4388 domain-containing protein [Deinococcus ficus]|jgi:hypothetical protein|uniref:GTPase-activating protein n=1 Tax=Deinococcus ficus TaxID=317577 RepID=A0A221SW39_9DEIO|nr:DUF4388 domain-containing protein [Deinococcus ficus]ASN80866.1 GTPase-activating protein [Deinococcus ficus]GHF77884.1 hypothetical protein GCM10017782_14830 [Deinococcus ficus]
MQGLLSDLPLLGVLELIHATRQTGVLDVQARVPFTVAFLDGEIVEGGILDWLGREALQASPLLADSGTFEFTPKPVTGTPLAPYDHFTTDWARASDEWVTICEVISSPSRFFHGDLLGFEAEEGLSVRAAAREFNQPLFDVASAVAEGVRDGALKPMDRYAWHGLKLRPAGERATQHPVARMLQGDRKLGDLVAEGVPNEEVRAYLLGELRMGLRFPGSGWVLRDLVWEEDHGLTDDFEL